MIQLLEQEKRLTVDLTLAAGRKRLSSQTGWIHLCYESEGTRHDTIPLYENFCFVLALFRSRLSEDILLGRQMCEKLLAFEVEGYFPVYIHEYPLVRDRGLALDILPIFVYIQREFFQVLGEFLEDKITALIQRIMQKADKEEAISYGRRIKLLAAQGKFKLEHNRRVTSSTQLVDELIALQVQNEYKESDLQAITRFWHAGLMMYAGPYSKELQEGATPSPTLLDFFMGKLFGNFSKRCLADHLIHLRTSLVYPFEGIRPGRGLDTSVWLFDQENKTLHLFWSDEEELHSFVIQGVTHWQDLGNSQFSIECLLPELEPHPGEEKIEVSCYLNYHPEHLITIEGAKANTFRLDQEVQITSPALKIAMRFSMIEERELPQSIFFGHVLRGNRPRQIGTRGEKRFIAYDWQFALRTVARKANPCTLRLCINLNQ